MPQVSSLGPLLSNTNLIGLFYECEESNIVSYTDNTTPYSCSSDTHKVISELEFILTNIFTGTSVIILKPL